MVKQALSISKAVLQSAERDWVGGKAKPYLPKPKVPQVR